MLADRYGPRVILTALGLAMVAGLGLTAVPTTGATLGGLMLLGAAGGLSVTANATIWTRTYGLEGVGELQGLAGSGQVAGAALGPLPLALSLALTGGYAAGIGLLGALALWALVAGALWRLAPGALPATVR